MIKPGAARLVKALRGLARNNVYEFCRSPKLLAAYWRNHGERRHKYTADLVTCGFPDCWSTYRALIERYGENGPIYLDCEDAAAAHSAALKLTGYDPVYIGFTPGQNIGHAISGILRDGKIQVIDPSIWHGMGPLGRPYEPVYYLEV